MRFHKCVTVEFGGEKPPLTVCSLLIFKVDPPSLFENLSPNAKPISTRRRRYSKEDYDFIKEEINRLLSEGIIEPSNSPWRAQVVVTHNENRKKRLVIDYSQTINRFTLLDAYPLPSINDLVNKVAQYQVFSKLDLKSAYHQLELKESERKYTGFEAAGSLYHFRRVPFGVTNGVAC